MNTISRPACPPATSRLHELYAAILAFDCCERYTAHELYETAQRVLARYDATGAWPYTVEELKCTLYYLQRVAYQTGADPAGPELARFLQLYQTLRSRWHECPPTPPRAADGFSHWG